MKARKIIITTLIVLCAMVFSGAALAGKRPNPRAGKSLYKATCKVCHVKDGEAVLLSPLTKTMAQWERFFQNEKKIGACVKRTKEKTGTVLGEADLRNISYYLVKHAADSDQPETCGQ